MLQYDVSKAQKLFNFKYINMEESATDILAQFRERGWY